MDSAKAVRADLEERLFDFVRDVLLLRVRGRLESEFVMRFQQVTAASMAKGVEDTAFYSYLRLVSLNEVGGDPGRFGVSVDEFHHACASRQETEPLTMLATSTHDTKRSEDVRTRIGLLSEIPASWVDAVRRWSAANAHYRTGDLPDRKTEYLLYQTLVGAWPISKERLLEYVRKAVREAKERTSWITPNPASEEVLEEVRRLDSGRPRVHRRSGEFPGAVDRTRANYVARFDSFETDRARCSRYLSGNGVVGPESGGSGQSPPGRL